MVQIVEEDHFFYTFGKQLFVFLGEKTGPSSKISSNLKSIFKEIAVLSHIYFFKAVKRADER